MAIFFFCQVLILGCVLAKQNKGDSYFSIDTLTYVVGKVLQDHEEWIVLNGGYQSLVDELSHLVRLVHLKLRQAGRRSDAIKLALVGGMAAVGAYAAYKAIKYFFW